VCFYAGLQQIVSPFLLSNVNISDPGVLGFSGVISGGLTVVSAPGGVGSWPLSSITGFPPGITFVESNNLHYADVVAANGIKDFRVVYNNAVAAQANNCTQIYQTTIDIGGWNFSAGVYCFSQSVIISTPISYVGTSNLNESWTFTVANTVYGYPGVTAHHINCAYTRCGFQTVWAVGGSITLGPNGNYSGNFVALGPVNIQRDTQVNGFPVSLTDFVYLDSATINHPLDPALQAYYNVSGYGTVTDCFILPALGNSSLAFSFYNATIVETTKSDWVVKNCTVYNGFNGIFYNITTIQGFRYTVIDYNIPTCANPSLTEDLNVRMTLSTSIPAGGNFGGVYTCAICTTTAGVIACNFKTYSSIDSRFDEGFWVNYWYVPVIFVVLLGFALWLGWMGYLKQWTKGWGATKISGDEEEEGEEEEDEEEGEEVESNYEKVNTNEVSSKV